MKTRELLEVGYTAEELHLAREKELRNRVCWYGGVIPKIVQNI